MSGVQLRRLNKIYPNGFHAVRDQDLEIKDGELMVFVGPSGCGKSTTLNMIAGLEEITSGDVLINDRVVNDLESRARDVAMVFQSYALYPHMTVFENMAFALKLQKVSKQEIANKVEDTASILGINDLLTVKPAQLSGGQCQRVALGRAIVRDPQVFLFDEPLSNLDAKLRVQMRVELARLHQKLKTTMIYVTHDQVEAMTLGERIAVMDRGEIQQVDTPTQIYNRPINQFVAGFIGSPAMNLFPARLKSDGARLVAHRDAEVSFELPRSMHHKLELSADQEIVVGLRPEGISLCGHERADDINQQRCLIDVVEQIGNEMLVYFSLSGKRFVARMSPDASLKDGDGFFISNDHHGLEPA